MFSLNPYFVASGYGLGLNKQTFMSNKRMFSKQITTSDAFVDMPMSSQLLYFHLNMEADDDGFVSNPNRITKMVGANIDDLKILIAKRFLLAFESGVVVIKHWLLHNAVRKDMYKETQYLEEKKAIQVKDNNVYTEARNVSVTNPLHRLDQIRSDKNIIEKIITEEQAPPEELPTSNEIPLIIKEFEAINPAIKRMYGNKTQRRACEDLIKTYGFDRVITVIKNTLPRTNKIKFFPVINTPLNLMDKWSTLESAVLRYQQENKVVKNKVAF